MTKPSPDCAIRQAYVRFGLVYWGGAFLLSLIFYVLKIADFADFARHGVTLLRADWTRRDSAITAALAALGRNGVPVYVLMAPGRAPLVLTEILSVSELRAALATL